MPIDKNESVAGTQKQIIEQMLYAPAEGKKLVGGVASKANAGTINTGLASVDFAVLTPAIALRAATITGIAGGVLTVGLSDLATPTAIAAAENIYWLAVGTP